MTTSGWALRRIVNPEIYPVTLQEAASQCQVDADILAIHTNDLNQYIRAATQLAEETCKRSFIEQEWRLTASSFPIVCHDTDEYIELPMGPVILVRSVSYLDTDGTRVMVEEGTGYNLDIEHDPARLWPAYNTVWPSGRSYPGSVQIDYKAGYTSAGSPVDAENVPPIAKQAILMLIAHWFHNRGEAGTVNMAEIPLGFTRALDPLKVYP